MAELTSIYKYYYLQFGDKWYPGIDFENMQISENQLEFISKFVGPCVGTGWTVQKLTELRDDQLNLISAYLYQPTSDLSQKFKDLNLDFSSDLICSASTTSNITLAGGAPSTLDGITLNVNDKVLVKDQSIQSQNGIYNVSVLGTGSDGTWVRSEVLDSSSDFNTNFICYVSGGTANTSTLWIGSSLGNTFGSNSLYFDNAFKQCVKVYPGDGIVDLFYGKTNSPYYFRFRNEDDYYIWADKTTNIEYNNICKIVSPTPPDELYGSKNNSAYIAKIVSSFGSTLYDLPIVDKIIYGPNRKDLISSSSEFQKALLLNFSNHKHLGTLYSPEKINLSTSTILDAVPSINGELKQSSSVFILQNTDGSSFTGSFENQGIPRVYLNSAILDESNYKFDFSTTEKKLILKNSIEPTSSLKVEISNFIEKELYCIDVNGNLLSSNISASNNIFLTDNTQEDRTPSDNTVNLVYKNFYWNENDYLDAKLYVDNVLVSPKHYELSPNDAKLTIKSTFPYISSNSYNDIVIKLNFIGNEIQSKITYDKLENLNASSFAKGILAPEQIENLSHEKFMRYKNVCEFEFTKNLLTGFGISYFYPYNNNSDLQFNTEVFQIYKTKNNSNEEILYCTDKGLMSSDNTFTKIKNLSSWNNDLGKPIFVKDDLLQDSNENKNQKTFILTNNNKIYFSDNLLETWNKLKSPSTSNSKYVNISTIDLSTDEILNSSNEIDSFTYIYAGGDDGIFSAKIKSDHTENEWDWNKIEVYADNNSVELSNINSIIEISTKNIEFVESANDLTTFDRHIYVGSSDSSYPGLYYGNEYLINRIFDDQVKGILWIKDGLQNFNKNCVIWWNDYDVYITHASRLVNNSNNSYWEYPFEFHDQSFDDVDCATVSNISLSGLQTIDGFVLSNGDKVLVKNQNSKSENGIYIASSSNWTRSAELSNTSDYVNFKHVKVLNGTVNSESFWFLKPNDSFIIDTSDIEWDYYKFKIYSTTTPSYSATRSIVKDVVVKMSQNNSQQYIVAHTDGLVEITDGSQLSSRNLIWDRRNQGYLNKITSFSNNESDGILYSSTQNGFYKSTSFLWIPKNTITDINIDISAWNRTENYFNANDNIVILKNSDNSKIENFTVYSQWQLINILDSVILGESYKYENDFRIFKLDPWYYDFLDNSENFTNPNIVVYINDKPANVPFLSDPINGSIEFVRSISYNDYENVKITISNLKNFISNTGNLSHEELFIGAFKTDSIARLAVENNPKDSILYLNQDIDQNYKVLILDDGKTQEIVYVDYINNYKNPSEVYLKYSRSETESDYIFSASTSIHRIKDGLTKNLEDSLYTLIRNEKYNMASLNNSNTAKLIIKLDEEIPSLFNITPAPPISQDDNRGLKNIKYTNDFSSDSIFDSTNSIISLNKGNPSLEYNTDYTVNHCYDIENLSKNGNNSLVVTDRGIWKYNGNRWIPISDLNFDKCFFIKEYVANQYKIGTSNGLYEVDSNFNILQNTLYPQSINDYIFGFFDNIKFEAYAKSDGFVLITNTDDQNFSSQYASDLNNKNVNGLYKSTHTRIASNSFSNYDVIYIASDSGLYAVCTGTNSDIFSPNIVSRLMLNNPEGVNKIRNCFVPNNIPTIPSNLNINPYLFVLTDDGILKINNYRWCDPSDTSTPLLNIERRYLRNLDCLSYVLNTQDSSDGVEPGYSKIFIGTNYGVYRSKDGGNFFEPTNRFDKKLPYVYSLKYFSSTFLSSGDEITKDVLVACTDIGIWYSIDDGDNWYKSGKETDDSELPSEIKHLPKNGVEFTNDLVSSNYLAQTFKTLTSSSLIDKVNVYIRVDYDLEDDPKFQKSLLNNSIQVQLCLLDGSDKPNLSAVVASSSTSTTVNDLIKNQRQYFEFNYTTSSNQKLALVIRENITSDGISILRWEKSPLEISDDFGQAYTYYDLTWAELDHEGYVFDYRIFYDEENIITETQIEVGINDSGDIGWDQGRFEGLYVDDNGYLKVDSKFLITSIIDDTLSMKELQNTYEFKEVINSFLNTVKDRTVRIVDSINTEFTAYDLWTLNDAIQRKTSNGHVLNLDTTTEYISDLIQDGKNANLFKALDTSLSSLLPNSVYDLYWKNNDDSNSSRISNLVDFIDSLGCLRLTYLNDLYDESDINDGWDGQSNTIGQSAEASKLLLNEFSKQYAPCLMIFTDGENLDDTDLQNLKFKIDNYWNKFGININIFNMSKSKLQSSFDNLVYGKGKHFNCSNKSDLQSALNSLLHEGSNNIFKGYWEREFYYENSVFVKDVYSEFTAPVGTISNSECTVKFRYSTDHKNFTTWIELSSGVSYEINKKITNIEYQVTISEGWSGYVVSPEIQLLYHTIITPSLRYYFSDRIDTHGFINELCLTSESDNANSDIELAICRADSWNWNDYHIIPNNKNYILPVRQKEYNSTSKIEYQDLSLSPLDSNNSKFNILRNSEVFKWNNNYSITVFYNGVQLENIDYRVDNLIGVINFTKRYDDYENLSLVITELENIFISFGDTTTTFDYLTYTAVNGGWPDNNNVVILINNEISRENYILDYKKGTVTFRKYKKESDVISIFIYNPEYFRIGLKLSAYDNIPSPVLKFAIQYTTSDNLNKLSDKKIVSKPYISENRILLESQYKSIDNSLSVNYPISIKYNYLSDFNTDEYKSSYNWFIKKTTNFVEQNSSPNYIDRIVQRQEDLSENGSIFEVGDEVFVNVQPKDLYKNGLPVSSEIYTLTNFSKPYVTDVKISNNNINVNDYFTAGIALTAKYNYFADIISPNIVKIDNSTIEWYDKSTQSSTPVYTGNSLPAELVKKGSLLSFVITPFDTQSYGNPIESNVVLII